MAPSPALTDDNSLIAVLQNGIERFSLNFAPLNKREDKQLSRASELIGEDPATIADGNNARKKSRVILVDLLTISREVFFLCAIGTTLDALRKLRSQAYIFTVSTWWSTVAKPSGLETAIKYYGPSIPSIPAIEGLAQRTDGYTNLPPNTPPSQAKPNEYCATVFPSALLAQPEGLRQAKVHPAALLPAGKTPQSLTMSLHTLLEFLKENYADELVQINCPFDRRSLPSLHFGPPKSDIKMELGHGIAFEIMKHGMGTEEMQPGQ
ncbi:MAG: hypothetical protein Q9207_002571 [Kuettlingeria erythrocarpa]